MKLKILSYAANNVDVLAHDIREEIFRKTAEIDDLKTKIAT